MSAVQQILVSFASSIPPGAVSYSAGQTVTFSTAGSTGIVYANSDVGYFIVEMSGGGGGGGGSWNSNGANGGPSGTASGRINVSGNRAYTWHVGGGGAGGAQYAQSGHGGGASAVTQYLGEALIVAGGGGGGGDGWNGTAGLGGAGGNSTNQTGPHTGNGTAGGAGTDPSGGGGGGTGSAGTNTSNSLANASGSTGGKGGRLGGTGGGGASTYGPGGSYNTDYFWAGGGGGGGYFGGAGGWGANSGSGGGGGSSYLANGIVAATSSVPAAGGGAAAPRDSQSAPGGNGQIKMTFYAAPVSHTYIGGSIFNATGSAQTVNYPAGTTTGDLVIVLTHGFGPAAPSGFTSAGTTVGDVNGYIKNIAYKISAGESTCSVTGSNGFDCAIVTLRGPTAVNGSFVYNYATGGASNSANSIQAGTQILFLSDRGASGYPTLGSTPSNTVQGTGTYFYGTLGVYLNVSAGGVSRTFTDFNDSYGTSCLNITAT